MPGNTSSTTQEELLKRAGRCCECQAGACRHPLPDARCAKGLRGQGWHAVRRADGVGEKLWNLTTVCDACSKGLGRPE